jgi:hypothetical protein
VSPAVKLAAAIRAQPALDPDIIAREMVEDLPPSPSYGVTSQAALSQFAEIAADLNK